jgi:hypothetical protein
MGNQGLRAAMALTHLYFYLTQTEAPASNPNPKQPPIRLGEQVCQALVLGGHLSQEVTTKYEGGLRATTGLCRQNKCWV